MLFHIFFYKTTTITPISPPRQNQVFVYHGQLLQTTTQIFDLSLSIISFAYVNIYIAYVNIYIGIMLIYWEETGNKFSSL